MEPSELLRILVGILEGLGSDYLVTGSMATIAYGEPRFTNDLDVVVALPMEQVEAFCTAFPEDDFYYAGEEDSRKWCIQARRASECIPVETSDALAGASGSYGTRFVRIFIAEVICQPGRGAGGDS